MRVEVVDFTENLVQNSIPLHHTYSRENKKRGTVTKYFNSF
jgi:hypothetical protein